MVGFLQCFLTNCAFKAVNVQKYELQIEKIRNTNILTVWFKLFWCLYI